MDEIEHQLSELFEAASSRLVPPVEEILETSTALGRRLRRRRTAVTATAALGVVGIACGVAFGVNHLGIDTHARVTAAEPQATDRAASASALPSTPSRTSASAAGTVVGAAPNRSPQAGVPLLEQLLAAYPGRVDPVGSASIGVADVVYDDGHGAVEIIASVQNDTATMRSEGAFTCDDFIGIDEGRRPADAPAPSCTQKIVSGGRPETVIVTANDGAGFYDYEVSLFATDNLVISLTVGNGVPQGSTVDVTRTVPPLTLAEIEGIVADPGWLGYYDSKY